MQVLKFKIKVEDIQSIRLPVGGMMPKILSVENINGELFIYAIADRNGSNYVDKNIYIFGTGHEVPNLHTIKYISTVQQGPYVWHVFEDI